jgi:catechol 2,3-dioxygenase-like lactoylglutathione lyase family enzyme
MEQSTGAVTKVEPIDMKLEVVVIPVSDVEWAKEFYRRLGWRLDATPPGVVQFTPHGSSCSVIFGGNFTSAAPGSAQGLWLIVSDIQSALDRLAAAGIQVDEVFHIGASGKVTGVNPEHSSYSSFASFRDPDGNSWVLQEITTRLPGRIDSATTSYGSVSDLADALRRAEAAHGKHEMKTGKRDENWPDWYSSYMVAEQAGTELPT